MVTFRIDDMTCARCAGLVSRAIKQVDARALLEVELDARLVHVVSVNAEDEALAAAIREAGYTPFEP